jgi:hypothetical protein
MSHKSLTLAAADAQWREQIREVGLGDVVLHLDADAARA